MKKLFNESPDWFKQDLIDQFGENAFKPISFKDIKSFEDACEAMQVKPEDIIRDLDTVDEIAYKKLKVIAQAINQGWTPNWTDTDQPKWYPWFKLSSGFGFSSSYYHYTRTSTSVGSRLCFESEEKANYAGKQFEQLYKDLLTLTK
jgi:hypothetical protein